MPSYRLLIILIVPILIGFFTQFGIPCPVLLDLNQDANELGKLFLLVPPKSLNTSKNLNSLNNFKDPEISDLPLTHNKNHTAFPYPSVVLNKLGGETPKLLPILKFYSYFYGISITQENFEKILVTPEYAYLFALISAETKPKFTKIAMYYFLMMGELDISGFSRASENIELLNQLRDLSESSKEIDLFFNSDINNES